MKTNLTDIRLAPLDDLFETVESREDNQRERIYEIELSKIQPFPDHPYHVKDDERTSGQYQNKRPNLADHGQKTGRRPL